MHHRIKEITDKIHKEGFEKANQESEAILAEARKEAEAIIQEAQNSAANMIEEAKKEANNQARKIDAEVRLSSRQALLNLKKEISELIQASVLKEPLNSAFEDQEFIRSILETLVENWSPCSDNSDLNVLVPGDQLEEMDSYLKQRAGETMNRGLVLNQYGGSGKGFEIQPSNGHYKINITDEAFEVFLKEHFKPKTLEFLYGSSN